MDTNSTSEKHGGGGIYIDDADYISVKDTVISENTSDCNAGGILIYRDDIEGYTAEDIVIDNVTLTDNTAARFGGGIFVTNKCEKLTITNSSFTRCKSLLNEKKGYSQDPNLGGGGISVDDGSTFTTLDLSNNAFTDCTAETAGGAIAMKCVANSGTYQTKITTLKLDGCTFDGCKTVSETYAGYGGALCLISRFGTISYNGGSIKNCEATNGSAIFLGTLYYDFVAVKAFNITNVTFKGNKNTCNSNQINNNYVSETIKEIQPTNGGAITTTKASAVMTLTGCIFKDNVNNNVESNGGAISWRAGSMSTATNFEVSATKLIIDGCTFQGNTAANGGAVYTSIPTGAVTVTLKGSTQVGVEDGGNVATEYGGGLYVHHSGVTLDVEDCTVSHNEAKYGGGLYVSSAAVANLNGGTVSFNDASSHGGGIHASNATVNISGTDITENTASKGGGISAISGADVTMSGGFIRANKAEGTPDTLKTSYHEHQNLKGVGGGVYVVDGVDTNRRTTFTLTTEKRCGLYGNIADFAADDVFANGVNTSLDLPRASSMTIDHETYKVAEGWYEDYNTGDTNYALGLAGNTVLGGQRYRDVKNLYPIRAYVDQTENELNASVSRHINTDDTYVCLTLAISDSGVDKLTITTIVDNADSDQLFVYVVSGITNTGEAVSFSVSMLGNSSETIYSLPEGTYSVTAYTDWAWRYENSAVYANGSLQQGVSVGSFIISKNGVSPVVVFISDLDYLYWLNGNSEVVKNTSQAGIYLSEYGTHFSNPSGKLTNVTATPNSFNFTLTGAGYYEYAYFPIKGLTPGKTYRIDFSETFNGEYLNGHPYGCGAFTTHPTSHYFWGNQINSNTIPQLDLTNADKRAWYTRTKGTQSGYIEFTAGSSIMYWVWCFGDITDGVAYPMAFEGVSLSEVVTE